MQRMWYYFLRWYVRLGLKFYFKDVVVHGDENIPKGAVIFAANHQNAFMDALVIICFNSHITYSLARADIFKRPFARWLLSSFNMIPIYRIRDGWKSLNENQKTFNACYHVFSDNHAVVIFPEGNHGNKRRVRSVSKGFTRIAFDSLEKDPNLNVSILPVGLNYSQPREFKGSVSIYFGKPLRAKDYPNDSAGAKLLRDDVSAQLKQLTTHVEDESNYNAIISTLERSKPDYLDPADTNDRIEKIQKGTLLISSNKTHRRGPSVLAYVAETINLIPLFCWRLIRKRIKDPVFISSMKFGVGIFLFPAFYLVSALVFYFIFGPLVSGSWLLVAAPSMLLYKNRPA